MNEQMIQTIGYSEMYEWSVKPNNAVFGKFVTFDKSNPSKITLFGNDENDLVIGVSTICAADVSDNPDEWYGKYMINKYGDYILQKETLAVGTKVYDENLEMSLIRTYPWEHYIKVINKDFDETKQYIPRVNRVEWVRVNLLGKCFVEDNGKCNTGDFCMPYVGTDENLLGTAVPATENAKHKYYVLGRISDNTILILNK